MPKIKLTKSGVDRILYTDKGQVIFHDTELSGFCLVVGRQTKTYAVQKDMQGRSVRVTIGRHGIFTPEEARKIAHEKLRMMAVGVNPNAKEQEARIKAVTIGMVLDSYLINRKNLSPRSKKDYQYNIDKYIPDWKSKQMVEISKEMIGAKHLKLGENHGTTVANKVMRIVRALFNYANATYDVCPINPVKYLSNTKGWYKEKRRRSYIKPHDLRGWWEAVHSLENDTYRDFLLLLLFTGLRRGEAAQLRWKHVDFRDRTLHIPDTKNGDPLTLPLGDYLYAILLARSEKYGNAEYVFAGSGKSGFFVEPKKGIQKVVEDSGVKFSCHDLRRTFITIAESQEISAYALKRLINHKVTEITGSYIIVDVSRLREPVRKIEETIIGYVGENS